MNLISAATAATELGCVANDPRLVRIVTAVQSEFRAATGRTFEQIERVVYLRGFGPGVDYTFLPESPVIELAEVRYDPCGNFAAATVQNLTQFYTDGFKLHWKGAYFEEGSRVAKVTFTAGYEEDDIPADLQSDLYEEVFARYRRGADEQFQSVSVPGAESFTRGKLGNTTQFAKAVRRYAKPI